MQEYISLLRRNKDYRYLWLGNVVSLLGDWFNLIAAAELITELSSAGVAISYLFLARFLPLFAFSPLAGVLADRYDRKMLMVVSDVLRAIVVWGFLVVGITGQVWLFYLLTVAQFALSALFTPARSAVVAMVVDRQELVTANALDSFTWSTMLALGAFFGGIVAAVFGAETAFILDGFTFLLSGWFISRVVLRAKESVEGEGGQGGWLDFVDGFRYLWGRPYLLILSLIKAAGSLVWGAVNVLEISFAEDVFPLTMFSLAETLRIEDGGTASLGIIYVISGLGTGLGPLFMRRWLGSRPPRLILGSAIGMVLVSVGIWGLGVAPTFGLFLLATLVRTVGSGTMWVFSAVLLQIVVPDRYRGRVFAFEFAMLTLTQSVSILLAGVLQDSPMWSLNGVAFFFAGLGMLLSFGWVSFYSWSRRNSSDERVEAFWFAGD
ncbi:MFS transporter [Candidatus Leptofilum sp.]|uniref:MFS transporter n=1 Tax=Candidatus Leptofilum sp. TaxID=3241576 RepID=UPI003B5B66D1